MKPTIYSIAAALGVSASTVSRAFSRPELVRAELRERILSVAKEQGYQTNRAARELVTGTSAFIGIAVVDITNPFIPPLVREIDERIRGLGRSPVLLDLSSAGESAVGELRNLASQVAALVIVAPRMADDELRQAVGAVPTLLVNHRVSGFPSVLCENTAALREAAASLERLGHRRLLVLTGPEGSWAAQQRASALREWADQSPEIELMALGPINGAFDAGRSMAPEIISSGATGVLAFDDMLACGVIAGLLDAGHNVPNDYSVIGCDDVLLARTTTPQLSTIAAPVEELGSAVALGLTALLAAEMPDDQVHEGTFLPRGTTAPAPSAPSPRHPDSEAASAVPN